MQLLQEKKNGCYGTFNLVLIIGKFDFDRIVEYIKLSMLRKIVVSSAVFVFAFGILFTSVLRTAAVKYETNGVTSPSVLADRDYKIDYTLPYPGNILPDSFLWPLKALRDRIWLFITTDQLKKVELKILFADKRIGGAVTLFGKGKNEIALSTLTKAEKYLEDGSLTEEKLRVQGKASSEDLSLRLANAALKHYEVLLDLESKVPDDMKTTIIISRQIPIKAYERARNALLAKGITPPVNPFTWE
jgi:hypothetical protein